MIEGLEKIIRRRRETILRLVEERGRVREQEPERAGQIDTEVELEFKAIQEEVRSLRSQLMPVKEEAMSEEKKRVIEIRKEEIKALDGKIANIRRDLEDRPDNKPLTSRLEKLKGRRAQLLELNENGIVAARTPNRRSDFPRSRYFGTV